MKLTEYIKRREHLKDMKADVPHNIRPFKRWVEEYDKFWGLKPIP